jgi:anti-sigma factor RsiW
MIAPLASTDTTRDAIHDHLDGCYACSAELATLNQSLSAFRNASHSMAQRQFSSLHRSAFSPTQGRKWMVQPLYFALAAALLVATAVPLALPHHPSAIQPAAHQIESAQSSPSARNAESDEALLEGIDQDLSASVPEPMQPLADPTATSTSVTSISTQRTN